MPICFPAITARIARTATALPLLALLSLAPVNAAETLQESARQTRYEQAVLDFRAQRWAVAYAGFARLADAGHAPSAEMAHWMHRQGGAVFGSEWSASPDQQRRWSAMLISAARRASPSDDLAGAE